MDNQRLITWGLFAFLAFMTWQAWNRDYGPQPVPPTGETATPNPESGAVDLPGIPATDSSALPSVQAPGAAADTGSDTPAADATTARVIVVRTDVVELHIDTRGGTLAYAEMLRYPVHKDHPEKVVLLNTAANDLGLIRSWLRARDGDAPDADTVYTAEHERYELGDADELVVPMTWVSPNGVTVEKRYVLRRGQYAITLEQRVSNAGDTPWTGDQVTQLIRRNVERDRSMFDPDTYSFDGPLVFDGEKAEKLEHDDLLDGDPEKYTGRSGHTSDNGWVASIQHHFLSAIIPAEGSTNVYTVRLANGHTTASVISAPETVEPGDSAVFARTLFIGPKLQHQLEAVHPRLDLSVDYGLLTVLSAPMFWLLEWVHSFVGNWGWAIILVTLIIKLAFYKLTAASGRSMAKMREIQPRMKALQDRYKDDRQALSQAMMDLYKREKINPAAGCLPILIQMPFFLAFYWVLIESVEMRQAPFALWINDLSVKDPYFILPLIMGAAMLFQQKLNPAPPDPVQARVMQIMPVMFTVFFAFFPSGLVLYWVTNTLLSIAQQWRINKLVHAEALARKAGRKKNKKGGDDPE